jgi:hypothetical protein
MLGTFFSNLAEPERNLERLGIDAFDPPQDFWKKLGALPTIRAKLRTDVKRALEKPCLPV